MRLKNMYTVPKGQKVTEKQLLRVLTASICTIALCMTCLVGTTWALFSVSIENTGNEIQIGTPAVVVTVNGTEFTSGTKLKEDDSTICITHGNVEDDLQQKSTLYVTLTIQTGEETISRYITLKHENGYQTALTILGGGDSVLSWEVSWFAPAGAIELIDPVIEIAVDDPEEVPETSEGEEIPEESTGVNGSEDPSEGSSEPADPDPSEDSSEPADPDPSEGGSEPADPDPSEGGSEPADPDPSEGGSEPADPDPSEGNSEPAENGEAEAVSEPGQTESADESIT